MSGFSALLFPKGVGGSPSPPFFFKKEGDEWACQGLSGFSSLLFPKGCGEGR